MDGNRNELSNNLQISLNYDQRTKNNQFTTKNKEVCIETCLNI